MGRGAKVGGVVLVLVSVAVAVACSSGSGSSSGAGTKISASDFDQTCASAKDCILVAQGECAPPCGYGAIRAVELAKYNEEQKRIRALPECQNQGEARCTPPPPVQCQSGKCAVNPSPPPVSASQFDRTCTTKDDCTTILEYNGSCAGGCAFATIAKKDLEAYQAKAAPYRDGCTTAESTLSSCPALEYECSGGQCTGCPIGSPCPKDAGADN